MLVLSQLSGFPVDEFDEGITHGNSRLRCVKLLGVVQKVRH